EDLPHPDSRGDGRRGAAARRLRPGGAGAGLHGGGGLMAESTEEKTEQASDRKMKEVRSKGQLSRSQDLTAWIGMGVAGAVLPWTLSQGAQAATDQVLSWRTVIEKPEPAV